MDNFTLPPLAEKPGLRGLHAHLEHQMFKFIIWTDRKMSITRVRLWYWIVVLTLLTILFFYVVPLDAFSNIYNKYFGSLS